MLLSNLICFHFYPLNLVCNNFVSYSDDENVSVNFYVICDMYVDSHTILVVVNHLSRLIVVLDGLPGIYGFKYDSATACGLPLYLYSYKLVGSATHAAAEV